MRQSAALLLLPFLATTVSAAAWTSGGPRGGVTQALAASASNPRVVYAGGVKGVFRTDDNGNTWRDVSNGVGSTSKLVVDPLDSDTVYAISGTAYRTTDGGSNWSPMNLGLTLPNTIVIDPTNPRTLYASGDCGVIFKTAIPNTGVAKSTDGGVTWHDATQGFATNNFSGCIAALSLDPANPSHLFASSQYGAGNWESFDGAATWVQTAAAIPSHEVLADPRQPMARYGTDGRQILVSWDAGRSWSAQATAGLPLNSQAPVITDLAIDPAVPRLFTALPAGIFRSGDRGQSWIPAGDAPAITMNAVVFNPVDATVMTATSQGVFRAPSPAFSPWTPLNVPESGVYVSDVTTDPRNASIVYAATREGNGDGRVLRSGDAGASWELISGRREDGAILSVDTDGNLWFGDRNQPTLHRVPAGTTDVQTVTQQFEFIVTVTAHPTVPGLVYVGGRYIWRTYDGGATWARCGGAGSPFSSVVVSAADPNIVYVGSIQGVWKSTDRCATFQPLDAHPNNTADVFLLAVAPSNSLVLYRKTSALTSTSRSDDGGQTWNDIAVPFAREIQKFVVDPRDPRSVWVALLDHGVLHSADAGLTWVDISDGLPGTPASSAMSLAIDSSGKFLHAGLQSSGVWDLRVPRGRGRAVSPR